MADLNSSLCISTVEASVLALTGLDIPDSIASPNPLITALNDRKGGRPVDRVVLYNPDAVALWVYQKYTAMFADAAIRSDLAIPMLSVMPSVTPVCFASMYSGVQPNIHGIRRYEKPVLTVETLFDRFITAGKKCAIVSTAGDSISMIFLNREMDYFIYPTVEEVNEKALALIDQDIYDLIVIYNGNYDGRMHKFGPESPEALAALADNVAFYARLVDRITAQWTAHRVFYGFCPDHGCHEIDGGCGSHGLDMEEDMNVIHFYGIN